MTQRPLPKPLFDGKRPLLIVGLDSDPGALGRYTHGKYTPDSVSIGQLHGDPPPETDGVTALPRIVRPFGGPIRISALTTNVGMYETARGGRLAIFIQPVCSPNKVFSHIIITDDDGGKNDLVKRMSDATRRRGEAGAYPVLAEIDSIVRQTLASQYFG